ncbi:MAG: glycosyltransferase [Chloroflexi bacterium]|nr:glycosyltransferase [Chloroflexota bacterium]
MKIVLVSSWPPRHCGIGTYSAELVAALRQKGHDVEVVCHTDGGRPGETQIHPVIDMSDPYWDLALYKTVEAINPDVVHIQHEYGLYNYHFDGRDDHSTGLLRPLYLWRLHHRPTVITYHSVYTTLDAVQCIFMDISLKLATTGIVHEDYQKIHLPYNIGRVPKNVYVVSHGAKEVESYPKAKEELGLAGNRTIGVMGWWEPNKGFERVVRLWPSIKKEMKDSWVLVVAGDARPGSTSGIEYKPRILRAIEESPARDSIKVIMGSFSPEEYDKILSALDLIVLPYSHASQSGNLAHAFAMGVPAIVTDIEGLKAAVEDSRAGITVARDSDFELEAAIRRVMTDPELQEYLSQQAKAFVANKIRWSMIAVKHITVYTRALEVIGRRWAHQSWVDSQGDDSG